MTKPVTESDVFHSVAASADLYRVSVYGPGGRADLAVPATARLGRVLPLLVDKIGGATPAPRGWLLQRLGESPLSSDSTMENLDLRDGDVLYLRAADDPMPPLVHDDLPHGVAETVARRSDRWNPAATHGLFVVLAALALATLWVAVLAGAGSAVFTAVTAGLLTAGACVVELVARRRALGLVLGLGAITFAGTVAPLAGHHSAALLVLGACAGTGAAAVVLVAGTRAWAGGPLTVYGTVLLTSIAATLAAALVAGYGATPAQAVTTVAVAMFLLGAIGPRLATRIAGLRTPPLPRSARELRHDTDPEPGERLAGRVAMADVLLGVVVTAGAIAFSASVVLLSATVAGWLGWVLPAVFAGAVALRARALGSRRQRGAALCASAVAVACLLARVAVADGIGVLALPAVVALLVLGAVWLPGTRLRPGWGRIADIAELWTAIALVPLLLQLLHTYALLRAMAG